VSFQGIVGNVLVLVAVVGAAAFFAMYLSWRRHSLRMTRVWAAVWLVSILAFGVLLAVDLRATFGGPTDGTMERLVAELDAAYPEEVAAIDYENAPPLDPATLFIDVQRSMSHEAELTFICEQINPRVDAVDSRIDISSSTVSGSDC
jgi:hypothetical protein